MLKIIIIALQLVVLSFLIDITTKITKLSNVAKDPIAQQISAIERNFQLSDRKSTEAKENLIKLIIEKQNK